MDINGKSTLYDYGLKPYWRGDSMFTQLEDHGLPLVQLKEQRRDLVVAMTGQHGPIPASQVMEIAAIQQAIAAIEAVVSDLDAELESAAQTPNKRFLSLVG
jgi:hypothetical protein